MQNADEIEFTPEVEYPEEFKTELLNIIRKSNAGKALSSREASMLFFWVKHMNEPRFDFTEKYRYSHKTVKNSRSKNRAKKGKSK